MGPTTFAYILAPQFYPATLAMIPWLEARFPNTKFGALRAEPSIKRQRQGATSPDEVEFAFTFFDGTE